MRVLFASVFVLFIAICVQAQPAGNVINGGLLNGHALTLPKPEYPESTRQARIGGIVGVNVLIDESGEVISAVAEVNNQHEERDAAGHKLPSVPVDATLREAAEIAARQATFAPMFLGGAPAKLKGKLLYNFVADNSDQPPRVGQIYGPSLNLGAISLPKPVYPGDLHVSGSVTVYVVIDTEGNVISAEAISGPTLLRASAVAAARKAKFTPHLLAGQPVRFDGVLSYNFIAPKNP